MNSIKEILDIKLHGETLKILIITKDNRIAAVKLNIAFWVDKIFEDYETRSEEEEVLIKFKETVARILQ